MKLGRKLVCWWVFCEIYRAGSGHWALAKEVAAPPALPGWRHAGTHARTHRHARTGAARATRREHYFSDLKI